jgi:aminoglycoside phosphotransferase
MNLERVIAVRTSKTIYRDNDNVVKVFDNDYSKVDVLNEALNQAIVENLGLNIPKIKSVENIDGKWAIVSEYIKGKTLSQLIQDHPEKKEEYLEQFVNLQISMHQIKAPQLKKLKDKMNTKITQTDLDATTRYELHTRLEGMPKHNKLCHGDFNPSNIIIKEDGTAFILDWSHATQGNASADVARTYLLFWLAGDINGANEYLDLYCNKTGVAKKYVQSWLPIVAASQSVKGNAKEREFLLSWVNVVDYE